MLKLVMLAALLEVAARFLNLEVLAVFPEVAARFVMSVCPVVEAFAASAVEKQTVLVIVAEKLEATARFFVPVEVVKSVAVRVVVSVEVRLAALVIVVFDVFVVFPEMSVRFVMPVCPVVEVLAASAEVEQAVFVIVAEEPETTVKFVILEVFAGSSEEKQAVLVIVALEALAALLEAAAMFLMPVEPVVSVEVV